MKISYNNLENYVKYMYMCYLLMSCPAVSIVGVLKNGRIRPQYRTCICIRIRFNVTLVNGKGNLSIILAIRIQQFHSLNVRSFYSKK